MKIAFFIVGFVVVIIVVLIIGVFVIGSRLPQSHIASRSIRLNQPLPRVYAVVRDFGSSAAWRTDVNNVEMLERSENGFVRFRENGSNGTITYELLNDEPNQRIVTKIADRDLGYSGTWTYEFLFRRIGHDCHDN